MNATGYKIEKGIPIPTTHESHGLTGLMRQMELGDSILISLQHSRTGLYVMAAAARIRVTVRTQDDGFRVWRIA